MSSSFVFFFLLRHDALDWHPHVLVAADVGRVAPDVGPRPPPRVDVTRVTHGGVDEHGLLRPRLPLRPHLAAQQLAVHQRRLRLSSAAQPEVREGGVLEDIPSLASQATGAEESKEGSLYEIII